MTDPELLTAVEAALPGLTHFDRAVYALARGRIMRGVLLKPAQRTHLLRVLELAQQLTPTTKEAPYA